jgi:bis(5'-nucleosyl)-tetraphosphatase (symmetrical)
VATWAIGDIQGCDAELGALLDAIDFDSTRDRLWLVGDLVNRGPASLAVLRRVRALGACVVTVLGNHDLHLLACAHLPGAKPRRRDTFEDVLRAPDRAELLDWLRRQPLLHYDARLDRVLVHAGLSPEWDLATALACAAEAEAALRGPDFVDFLAHMYGDEPDRWDPMLHGPARLRFITNCLTRMRYCAPDGRLEMNDKSEPTADKPLLPWFGVPGRANAGHGIVFGHWSTLRLPRAHWAEHHVYPLDSGAVWGGELSALCLEDDRLVQVRSGFAADFD